MIMQTTRPVCESSMDHQVGRFSIARHRSCQATAMADLEAAPTEAVDQLMWMLTTAVL